jgi:hypothetical protein
MLPATRASSSVAASMALAALSALVANGPVLPESGFCFTAFETYKTVDECQANSSTFAVNMQGYQVRFARLCSRLAIFAFRRFYRKDRKGFAKVRKGKLSSRIRAVTKEGWPRWL